MTQADRSKSWPETPGYDNPSRNKGDLQREAESRKPAKPNEPIGHASDKKLGQKPPARRTPLG